MNSPDRNSGDALLICYDGSDDAKHAIQEAGKVLVERPALVLTAWQPTAFLGGFSWGGEAAGMVDFVELDRAGADDAGRIAEEGAGLAREAGLEAEPTAVKAAGPVWKTIVETAHAQDAAAIVLGSRGLTGLRSMLLGSVSSAVVQHADRPTLVVHRGGDDVD